MKEIVYEPREDVLAIDQNGRTIACGSVGQNWGLIAYHPTEDDDVQPVVALDIIGFSAHLPLQEEGMYDSNTDTRVFGDKFEPDLEYQAIENDDLVAYWKKVFYEDDDGKEAVDWYLVAVALHKATHHLGKVIARHPKLRNAK